MATNVLQFPRQAANDNRPITPPPAVLTRAANGRR